MIWKKGAFVREATDIPIIFVKKFNFQKFMY